jgi:hypothetical protein
MENYLDSSSWVVPAGSRIPVPERDVRRSFIMIIFVEDKQPLFEVVELVGKREYAALLKQMEDNPDLAQTLVTPMSKLPKYRFLMDDSFFRNPISKYVNLLNIIGETMKRPQFESFFIKTPKGLYVGFIAIAIGFEEGKRVVEDVKTFSFGLGNEDDENQMYKDLPAFLDNCLKKYGKISWEAIEGNKANRAYAIYTKRRKGTISKEGKYIRYVCRDK